jgi:hypothetical protein
MSIQKLMLAAPLLLLPVLAAAAPATPVTPPPCDCAAPPASAAPLPQAPQSSPPAGQPITGDTTGMSPADRLLGEQAVLRDRFRRHLETGEQPPSWMPVGHE